MATLLNSPATFYVLVLLAFGMLATMGWIGFGGPALTTSSLRIGTALADREKDQAAAMGMPWRGWIVMRVGLLVIGGLVGYASQIPVVAVLAVVATLALPSWVVRTVASRRVLKQHEAAQQRLEQLVGEISRSRITVNQALHNMALDAPAALTKILAPLAGSGDIREALIEVAERGRTPEMEQIAMLLLLARTRDPNVMVANIEDALLPRLAGDLKVDRNLDKLMMDVRLKAVIMVIVISGLFFFLDTTQSFHSFYSTFLGQVSLGVAILIVTGAVAMLNRMTRPPARVRWSVRRLMELEAAFDA